MLDSFLRLRGQTAYPAITSTNSQALLQLYRQNLGVGILAEPVLPPSPKKAGLATFRVEDVDLANDNRVVYHQDKRMTEALRTFIQTVADCHA